MANKEQRGNREKRKQPKAVEPKPKTISTGMAKGRAKK